MFTFDFVTRGNNAWTCEHNPLRREHSKKTKQRKMKFHRFSRHTRQYNTNLRSFVWRHHWEATDIYVYIEHSRVHAIYVCARYKFWASYSSHAIHVEQIFEQFGTEYRVATWYMLGRSLSSLARNTESLHDFFRWLFFFLFCFFWLFFLWLFCF